MSGIDSFSKSLMGDINQNKTSQEGGSVRRNTYPAIVVRADDPLEQGRIIARIISLDENGNIKKQSVVRLMAITFLHNSNPKLFNNAININGNHDDLRIENVMWGTSSIQVRRKNNRQPELLEKFIASSVKLNTRKMTDDLEIQMVKMYKLGYSMKQLEDIFPIKKSMIFILLKKHNYGKCLSF